MSLKKIDGNIARIITSAAKLNEMIHNTAVMVLNHAVKYGDCTRALTLVKAMPASHRRTKLIAWFNKFSPIRVVLENDVVGMLTKDAKGYKPFEIAKAMTEPFYDIAEKVQEGKPPMDLADLRKWIEQQAKGLEKRAEEGKISEEEIATAKALAAQLRAIKVKHVPAANSNEDSNEGAKEPEAVAA